MTYINKNDYEFHYEWEARRASIEAELRNQFQNQDKTWYKDTTWKVFLEYCREGDSIANIINRL